MMAQCLKLSKDSTEITFCSITVLFSYRTPVAAINNVYGTCYVTSKQWSKTTSKHITQWLNGRAFEVVDQEFLDNL